MSLRAASLVMLLSPLPLLAQAEPSARITPRNSVAFSLDYAPTSEHIFLGQNEQRRLTDITVGYRRRLTGNAYVQWSWMIEAQPFVIMLEPVTKTTVQFSGGGPVLTNSVRQERCLPGSVTLSETPTNGTPFQVTFTTECDRIVDYGAGLSPLGQHIRFLPQSRLAPFVDMNAGFIVFNRSIPSDQGRSFNFQFAGGAGLEFALSHRRMVSAEYRISHISNANTAPDNSGIDQQMVRVSYIFGR